MHAVRWLVTLSLCAFVSSGAAANAPETGADLAQRITAAAAAHRLRLSGDDRVFSGPGWDWLIEEGRRAQFFLLGEQHGIAENAWLAAALFEALVPAGYNRVAIETSPPLAATLDRTLRDGGIEALRERYALAGATPAFFGLREEAGFIARAIACVAGDAQVLWGLDYEVAADRDLIRWLHSRRKPRAARKALEALTNASAQSWERYLETRNPQFIFSFDGDPALVRAVEDAWPGRDAQSAWVLDTLEETLEINRLWSAGQGWQSNARRAAWLRKNFLRYWRAEKAAGRAPKVLAKFGASHMIRGLNTTETFDLGSLLPEVAALEAQRAFSLLVLAGPGSMTAVFDPVSWSHRPASPRDAYGRGLEPILDMTHDTGFTLFDLRPLRALLPASKRSQAHPHLMRVVHGFDALLVMTGSTPASDLVEATSPP